jgi:hypothetical protein
VTILPRIRCALSSWTRQLVTVPSRRSTSSGPFTHHGCLTCPSVPMASVLRRHRLTCPRQPASQPGTRPGIRPVIRETTWLKDPVIMSPASRFLSAAGIRFLGILFPPRSWAFLTVGLPPPAVVDPDGVATFHTHEIQPGRVPYLPRRRRCSHSHRRVLDCRLPTFSGQPLIIPGLTNPSRRVAVTRHQRGFTIFTLSTFPSPVIPGRHGHPWALP